MYRKISRKKIVKKKVATRFYESGTFGGMRGAMLEMYEKKKLFGIRQQAKRTSTYRYFLMGETINW